MSKKKRLREIEEAMAGHPKGRPFVGNKLLMDPTPVAPPAGYKKQPSMIDVIRQQVAQASKAAEQEGFETVEEANDFDVDGDPFPSSPYEFVEEEFEVPPSVQHARYKEEEEDAPEEGDGGVLPPTNPPEPEQIDIEEAIAAKAASST
jgi:hypothetical protein